LEDESRPRAVEVGLGILAAERELAQVGETPLARVDGRRLREGRANADKVA